MSISIRFTIWTWCWLALGMSHVCYSQEQERTAEAHRQFTKDLQNQLTAGRRLAIVIGIDGYVKDPLKCCVKDANLLAATLRDRCGYDPDGILVMTDKEADTNRKPTLQNLRNQIRQFLTQATSKDTVLVSYSGHGGLGSEVTLTKERRYGFVCPLDFDGTRANETSLPIDELRTMLQECAAAQKLLILDSCHSGGAGTEKGFTIESNADRLLQNAQGLITFAACRREEVSSEDREVGHGVFTLSMVQGLEGLADFDQNKIVDSDEIYRHVLSQVPVMVNELFPGRNQTPIRVIGQDVVGVFALAPVLPRPKATAALTRMKPGETLKNSIGMPLVLLPRGSFIKGSPKSEYLRKDDEDFRTVILQKRILMGTYEVTQSEYETIMGVNPSFFTPDGMGSDSIGGLKTGRFPVEQVTWNDAVEFCKRLSELPEELNANRVYRLPTESEWEYACRAGSIEAFSTGQVIDGSQANIRADSPYWYAKKGSALGRTQTVGRYLPNSFGLYDMHGNVAEWCSDFYGNQPSGLRGISSTFQFDEDDREKLLEHMQEFLNQPVSSKFSALQKSQWWEAARNPTGPVSGKQRIIRGGSFISDVGQCRSAARKPQAPDYSHKALGFRIICEQSLQVP